MSEVSSIWKAWRIFCNGSPLYWAIPVAVLLFMLRKKNKYRICAGIALLLLFVFLYNPLSYKFLTGITGSSAYRIFWLLPGWTALAYIVFCIIRLIPWQPVQLILTILICAGGMFYAIRDN